MPYAGFAVAKGMPWWPWTCTICQQCQVTENTVQSQLPYWRCSIENDCMTRCFLENRSSQFLQPLKPGQIFKQGRYSKNAVIPCGRRSGICRSSKTLPSLPLKSCSDGIASKQKQRGKGPIPTPRSARYPSPRCFLLTSRDHFITCG